MATGDSSADVRLQVNVPARQLVPPQDGAGWTLMVEFLESVAAEVETHVGQAGWDQRPTLFALVHAARFAVDEPAIAQRLGLDADLGDALIPIEQDALPDGDLGEVLAQIAWPDSVAGCALSQEILILPPSAQDALKAVPDDAAVIAVAAGHPDRREARLVVAVMRDGASAALLRLRGTDDALLTGSDLAPNLVAALAATMQGPTMQGPTMDET